MQFSEKKVIVTGANRSMGAKIALNFAEQGADVVISYRSDEEDAKNVLKQLKKHGSNAIALYADFSSQENVLKFAKEALDHLGDIDILVNNAAMRSRETFFDISDDKLSQVFQINTIAPLQLAKFCADNMIEHNKKGSIINISSIAATMTMPKSIAYAASKAAMNKWTENAALNLAVHDIRVNAICPGVIADGMNADTESANPALWKYYNEITPLSRLGKPSDIANIVLFLCSEQAEWVTGQIIKIDGGAAL